MYETLALRTDIFVVEQNCAYPELDYHDQHSQHILLFGVDGLLACARLVSPGTLYELPSIGRVAVKKAYRKRGLARKVFEAALEEALRRYPGLDLKLQAQTYLENFYTSYGFRAINKPYPDFGIMHIDMVRKAGL